ncbi:MAG: hypothetical protein M1820_001203 [Bogoriella megaspora]|nr:MAG: hypothetical protein M1820_001203 [Bogoriella megaspora]
MSLFTRLPIPWIETIQQALAKDVDSHAALVILLHSRHPIFLFLASSGGSAATASSGGDGDGGAAAAAGAVRSASAGAGAGAGADVGIFSILRGLDAW